MKANFENIYEHMGYLFYALAAEFSKLSSREYSELEKLIDEHWQPGNTREAWLQSHLVQHLHAGIENAYINSLSAEEGFDIFENYYLVHKHSFGLPLREKIYECGNAIVHEFYQLHHDSELIRKVEKLLELRPELNIA